MQPGKTERGVIAALERRFSATWEPGDRPERGRLAIDGRKIAVEIAALPEQSPGSRGGAKARFRDDRVARRLLSDLEAAVEARGPEGRTAILTLGAPIKVANPTLAALTEILLDRLAGGAFGADETAEIFGNRARFRILDAGAHWTSKLVGFVFTGDPSPAELETAMRAMRYAIVARADGRPPDEAVDGRWLVLAGDWIADVKTYEHAFARLSVPDGFQKILMAYEGGRIEILIDRAAR